MSVVAEERILVVPTSLFHELGYFQGFSREIDRYWPRLVTGDHVEYRARGEMEEDPSFKQLIPYVLFRWTAADGTPHLFEYQRGSGQGENAGCTPSGASASAGTFLRSMPKSVRIARKSIAKGCGGSLTKKWSSTRPTPKRSSA